MIIIIIAIIIVIIIVTILIVISISFLYLLHIYPVIPRYTLFSFIPPSIFQISPPCHQFSSFLLHCDPTNHFNSTMASLLISHLLPDPLPPYPYPLPPTLYPLLPLGLGEKHPADVVHPHPHVQRQRVHLQPDQSVATLLQTGAHLGLVQGHHGDLHPRPTQVVALPEGPDEDQVAPGSEQAPDVTQGSGEGGQVRTDALQAKAGHQAVSPS